VSMVGGDELFASSDLKTRCEVLEPEDENWSVFDQLKERERVYGKRMV